MIWRGRGLAIHPPMLRLRKRSCWHFIRMGLWDCSSSSSMLKFYTFFYAFVVQQKQDERKQKEEQNKEKDMQRKRKLSSTKVRNIYIDGWFFWSCYKVMWYVIVLKIMCDLYVVINCNHDRDHVVFLYDWSIVITLKLCVIFTWSYMDIYMVGHMLSSC